MIVLKFKKMSLYFFLWTKMNVVRLLALFNRLPLCCTCGATRQIEASPPHKRNAKQRSTFDFLIVFSAAALLLELLRFIFF